MCLALHKKLHFDFFKMGLVIHVKPIGLIYSESYMNYVIIVNESEWSLMFIVSNFTSFQFMPLLKQF